MEKTIDNKRQERRKAEDLQRQKDQFIGLNIGSEKAERPNDRPYGR